MNYFRRKYLNFRTKCFDCLNLLNAQFACRQILVLGDSHAAIFRHAYWVFALKGTALKVVSVGGATASGVDNPNSTTQARGRFEDALLRQDFDAVLVSLGEVDTGFVIWYRAQTRGISIKESLEQTIQTYCEFLFELKKSNQIAVVSTPLPTIVDDHIKSSGDVANLRKKVVASQFDRTELTLRFNHAVKLFCLNEQITYMDFDRESLGSDGLVREALINKDSGDHHYDDWAYLRMLRPQVSKWIIGIRASGRT